MQGEALRRLVSHAYEAVPYYRKLFDAHGVAPASIRSLSDLAAIPITDRNHFRTLPAEEVIARGLRADRLASSKTSGSSGSPLTVRATRFERRVLLLSRYRARRHFGATTSDRVAMICYYPPDSPYYRRGRRRWVRDTTGFFPLRTIDMGLQPEQILEALRQYRPDFIGGYPGVLALLAEQMTARDRALIRPKAISVGGEVVTQAARRQITEGFGAPVYNCYSSEEFTMIAWECANTGELHVCADNIILEVLRDGRPAKPGEPGEVIGTNLHAFAMPFIRYRLGDVVTQGSPICACGQPFPTIRDIQGRTIDYFTLPDGRLVHPYDLAGVIHDVAGWVRLYELVQERKDFVILRVIPYGDPSPDAFRRLESAMEPILGEGVTFQVVRVAEIRPSPSSKMPYARSLVTPRRE
jgi:phenylacetate-CoA ligase